MTNLFIAEVLGLHAFLQDWLKGELANGRRGLGRLERALAEDFVVIQPDGSRAGKADVMRSFGTAYGEKPRSYALKISDLHTRMLEGRHCLISYHEAHEGEQGRARISTALLQRQDDSRIVWRFLHETLVRPAVPS